MAYFDSRQAGSGSAMMYAAMARAAHELVMTDDGVTPGAGKRKQPPGASPI